MIGTGYPSVMISDDIATIRMMISDAIALKKRKALAMNGIYFQLIIP